MRLALYCVGLSAALLCGACASKPDHFYTLAPLPDSEPMPLSKPAVHVRLRVTVPSLVDRAEMVLNTSRHGIVILDHERWAAPLSDQVWQTLARDIEQRRSDLLIGDRGFAQSASPPLTVTVDIVRMSAQRGAQASIEAHWRIVDRSADVDELGSAYFAAPLAGADYAAVAQAYSVALSELAERLAGDLRRR